MKFRHEPKDKIINNPKALKELGLTREQAIDMSDAELTKLVKKVMGDR